nr:SCO family protein [Natrarchaeobius chitinivorans]
MRVAGAAALLPTAGCLTSGDRRPPNTHLSPPENYDALREADLSYPIYGEELPDATLPDVLRDEAEVSVADLADGRHLLLTFLYTRCAGVCVGLASLLVHAQARGARDGFTDDINLAAITFDPESDTPDVLREWGDGQGFDYDLENVSLLRPETPERARRVVEDTYGEAYEYEEEGEDSGMPYIHNGLILLVNENGIVERSYESGPPQPADVLEDVESLVDT